MHGWTSRPLGVSARASLNKAATDTFSENRMIEAFFVSSTWISFSKTVATLIPTPLKTQYAVQFIPSVMTGISAWPEGLTSTYRIQLSTRTSLSERNSCELSVFSSFPCLHDRPSAHVSGSSTLRV